MQKFFTDKSKLFECNISVDGDGATVNETKARLVLEFPNNRNLLFHGTINEYGKCEVLVPALKELNESEGNVILEVIADETYFESWNDSFKLEANKKITVEVVEKEKPVLLEEKKTKVAVTINESKPEQVKETVNPIYVKFKDYVNEHNIDMKLIKKKTMFMTLLKEYKSDTNASKDDIVTIVEELQKGSGIL